MGAVLVGMLIAVSCTVIGLWVASQYCCCACLKKDHRYAAVGAKSESASKEDAES